MINAIRKEDADRGCLSELDYGKHLWMERELRSVANVSRRDIAEFLDLAARAGIRPVVRTLPLTEANRALRELKAGGRSGATVLLP